MLVELRSERDRIEQAIVVLERLGEGHKRRGRPPLWSARNSEDQEQQQPAKRRGRPRGSKNKPKGDS